MRWDDAMTLAEMIRKIESLEKRVRELESRPQQVHYHYPAPQEPVYVPPMWTITCQG